MRTVGLVIPGFHLGNGTEVSELHTVHTGFEVVSTPRLERNTRTNEWATSKTRPDLMKLDVEGWRRRIGDSRVERW